MERLLQGITIVILISATTFSLIGQAVEERLLQAPGATQNQGVSLTGRIRRLDSQPASGVRVAAIPAPDANSPVTADVLASIGETDSDGHYRLDKIPPGRYYVFAGLVDYPTYYPGVTSVADARIVEVTTSKGLEGFDFSLQRPVSLRVTGRLIGMPTPVTVTLRRNTGGAAILQIVSRPDGFFEFPQVPLGAYTLRAPGSTPTAILVEDADLNIDLRPESERPGVKVGGRVTGMSNLPPGFAPTVTLRRTDNPSSPFQTPVHDDGAFEFPKVPSGTYTLSMNPAFSGTAIMSQIEVGNTDLLGVTIQVPYRAEIAGRLVTEKGLAPVKGNVQLRRINGISSIPISGGLFRMSIAEGEYQVSIGQLPVGYEVKSIAYGGIDITQSWLKIDASTPAKELVATLAVVPFIGSGVSVSGRLTVSGPGLRLELAGQGGAISPAEVAVKEDGTFEFTNVLPGGYLVRLSGATLDSRSENLRVDKVEIKDLVLGAQQEAIVEGRVLVVDTAGNGIPTPSGLLVRFTQARGWTQAPLRRDSTFGLRLVEGEHALSMNNLPDGYSIKSIASGSVNLKSELLKVVGTNRPDNIEITLENTAAK